MLLPTPTPGLQLVATLYANRAAAALRMLRHEQVVHDTSRAVALLVVKGSSDVGACSGTRRWQRERGPAGRGCSAPTGLLPMAVGWLEGVVSAARGGFAQLPSSVCVTLPPSCARPSPARLLSQSFAERTMATLPSCRQVR